MLYLMMTKMGGLINQIGAKIFPWFKNDFVAPFLAGAIGIFALVILLYFLFRRFLPAFMQLSGCMRRLKSFASWEEFSRAENFNGFNAYMEQKKLFMHAWKEFCKTIIRPNEDESRAIWITVRPSVYLNAADLEGNLRLRSLHSWSNILVGIGLLLTFFGLVAALSFASQGISSAVASVAASALKNGAHSQVTAQTDIQNALVELLHAASFKFWTSIAGLGCSILLTLCHKWMSRYIEGRLEAMCAKIESLTFPVTPEWLADREYKAIRQQSDQLKNFNDTLAVTLGQALEKAIERSMPVLMSAAVAPVVERLDDMPRSNGETFRNALNDAMPQVMTSAISPLSGQIGSMIEELNLLNQSMVNSLTEKFGDVVTANAGTELRELATTLGQVRETLAATSQSVGDSGSKMSDQLGEAASELRSAVKSLVEMVEGMSRGVESDLSRTQSALQTQLASVGDNLKVLAEGIKGSLAEMGGQLKDSSLRAAEAFNEEIAGAVKRIETAAETGATSLATLVDSLRTASSEATGALADQTAGASRAMREAVERIAASLDSASRNMLDGASEASAQISSRLLDSIRELKDAARQNAGQIEEAVRAITVAGHAATQTVGDAANRTGVELDEKGQLAAGRLVSGASAVLENLSNAFDGFNERTNSLKSALEVIENRLATHAAALRKVNESAQSTVDAMAGTARTLKDSTGPLTQAEQGLA